VRDVAVVGGGVIGLAAADALARRSADVVVLERSVPGAGQSAGVARGFRHLHATPEKIAEAIEARAQWGSWSERAGEVLVGDEGALRLGGDPHADAARLRDAGLPAEVMESAGDRHSALARDAGPLLWDPRGGAIRAERAIAWLCSELGGRVRRAEVRSVRPEPRGGVRLTLAGDGDVRAHTAVVCAGAGLGALLGRAALFRRVVHLRVTFSISGRDDWAGATWADRSGRFGALTYGVADGPGRFALGLAELDAQPDPGDADEREAVAPAELAAVRDRILAYAAAAFPGLGPPFEELVRLLTILPGPDEDRYVLRFDGDVGVLMGHNLFKLAPLLGERIAAAVAGQPGSVSPPMGASTSPV
jgi:sarcosine oxidase